MEETHAAMSVFAYTALWDVSSGYASLRLGGHVGRTLSTGDTETNVYEVTWPVKCLICIERWSACCGHWSTHEKQRQKIEDP